MGKKGFSLMELVFALSILAFILGLVTPSFLGYRNGVEKQLHIVNALTLRTVLQGQIMDGVVLVPQVGTTLEYTLDSLILNSEFANLLDPSSNTKENYSDSTTIQLYNNGGSLQYYIKLTSQTGFDYINTLGNINESGSTEIHLIDKSQVSLN